MPSPSKFSEYGDDSEWSAEPTKLSSSNFLGYELDRGLSTLYLDTKFTDLKGKWRDSQLNNIVTYQRKSIDPDHHGDKISWSATFSPIKNKLRKNRPKSADNSRAQNENTKLIPSFFASLCGEDDNFENFKIPDISAPSPVRGKIRPKSASFQNKYIRVLIFNYFIISPPSRPNYVSFNLSTKFSKDLFLGCALKKKLSAMKPLEFL